MNSKPGIIFPKHKGPRVRFNPARGLLDTKKMEEHYQIRYVKAGRPGSSEVPRNPLTRWDLSSIPANGIFLAKELKNRIKLSNGWRTIKSLVHKNSTSQSTRKRNG